MLQGMHKHVTFRQKHMGSWPNMAMPMGQPALIRLDSPTLMCGQRTSGTTTCTQVPLSGVQYVHTHHNTGAKQMPVCLAALTGFVRHVSVGGCATCMRPQAAP
jgi:hypothetical protein